MVDEDGSEAMVLRLLNGSMMRIFDATCLSIRWMFLISHRLHSQSSGQGTLPSNSSGESFHLRPSVGRRSLEELSIDGGVIKRLEAYH